MTFHIYYDRSESRCWWGYWMDKEGNQIMEAVNAPNKELVLIELGAQRSTALEKSESVITIGSKVMIRGDLREAGKYTPDQLVDGKYVKRFGTNEPWVGVVRDINPWNNEALVGGGWRGMEMYELCP